MATAHLIFNLLLVKDLWNQPIQTSSPYYAANYQSIQIIYLIFLISQLTQCIKNATIIITKSL